MFVQLGVFNSNAISVYIDESRLQAENVSCLRLVAGLSDKEELGYLENVSLLLCNVHCNVQCAVCSWSIATEYEVLLMQRIVQLFTAVAD